MKKSLKFLTLILIYFIILIGFNVNVVKASSSYSNVLDDLSKDEKFQIENYPNLTYQEIKKFNEDLDPYNDISLLDVISIAEGINKELFIYVYNPTRVQLNITANQISMYCEYTSNPIDFDVDLYDLELVSSQSVFDKYLVKDFTISSNPQRYYNIVEISRPFIPGFDTSIENGETNDKAISVGKQWYCYYYNDQLVYEMGKFKTLDLEVTLNGNIYYGNGVTIGSLVGVFDKSNSWFVAFNVYDYIIDYICDAQLVYKKRQVFEDSNPIGMIETSYGEWSDFIPITITKEDKVTHKGQGLFGKTYHWNRIMSAIDFVSNFEDQGGVLNNTSKEILLKSQFVFSFTETEFTESVISGYYRARYYEVAEVDILRISFFDINGHYYNLGVVADKTTADKTDDGNATGVDVEEMFNRILMILGLIIGLVLLSFIPGFFNIFLQVISFIFKAIISIISFPFKFFKWLFKKFKKSKDRL